MAKVPKLNIDISALQGRLKAQFTGLNPNDPPSWPAFPRFVLCVAVTALVVVGLWFAWLNSSDEELTAERGKEVQLREDYQKKIGPGCQSGCTQKAAGTGAAVRHAVRKAASQQI